MRKLLTILFVFFAYPTNILSATTDEAAKQVEKEVSVDKEEHRMRFYLTTDFTNIASPSDGVPLTGIGVAFQGLYALNNNFAAGLSTWQTFSFTGSSVITAFDARLTYAITGKLMATDLQTTVDNSKITTVTDYDMSGFRAQLIRAQYYFNASATTIPYSGNGISLYYEHINSSRTSYVVGGRFDMISNTEYSATPMQIFVGVGTPF